MSQLLATSTPVARSIGSYRENYASKGTKIIHASDIHRQLAINMEGSLVSGVPVDVWIKAVLKFDVADLHLDEWNFILSPTLLAAYNRCVSERHRYRPFMCMMMQTLLDYAAAMKRIGEDVRFPCGIYFDAILGDNPYYGSGDIKRKLDGFATGEVGHAVFEQLKMISTDDDPFHLLWGHAFTNFEFKFEDLRQTSGSRERDVSRTKYADDITHSAPLPQGKRLREDYTDERGSKRPKMTTILEGEPVFRSEAFVPPANYFSGRSAPSLKTEITIKETQAADFAAEAMRSGRFRYSTCIMIQDDMVSCWYYDRMGGPYALAAFTSRKNLSYSFFSPLPLLVPVSRTSASNL